MIRKLLLITSLLVVTTACATVPRTGLSYDEQRILDCASTADCFLVHVDNGSRFDVRLYVNQTYLGFVSATKSLTLPLRRSSLDGSLCGQVRVHVTGEGDGYSGRDCGQPGGHFSIQIDDRHIWFTPWTRKT